MFLYNSPLLGVGLCKYVLLVSWLDFSFFFYFLEFDCWLLLRIFTSVSWKILVCSCLFLWYLYIILLINDSIEVGRLIYSLKKKKRHLDPCLETSMKSYKLSTKTFLTLARVNTSIYLYVLASTCGRGNCFQFLFEFRGVIRNNSH